MRAGGRCFYCDELVEIGRVVESVNTLEGPRPAHAECNFRAMMGSVAHIEQRCSCFVAGSKETDPKGLTCREAAKASVRAWEKRQRKKHPELDL